jgi:hypothetical protein
MSDELNPTGKAELTLEEFRSKLNVLEEQLRFQSAELASVKERIPDTNLISPNFLKRAFTVWGHYVVAGFIIAIPFICLTMFFALIIMLFSQQ